MLQIKLAALLMFMKIIFLIKMLKTCFLHTSFSNYSNKTCGEIICQTESSFIITCKFCGIKLFDYDEFIKHFRNTHWPEIGVYNNLDVNKSEEDLRSETDVIEIKNQKKDCDLLETGNNEENAADNEQPGEYDSDDLSKPLVILKKDTAKEKNIECVQCKRKFTTKFYLRFHIRQQHAARNFQCDKCNKSFVEKRYLTLHQRSHTGYTCQICHKVFDKYEALRYHGESHIETRNYHCDFEGCGKAFPNNRRLSAHKRSHYAQPSFVCEICGSRQRSEEFLIVHIRTHTGEKPYACKHCDRCFASKHFLQDHQSVHATERSHVCSICGKAFASSKSLYHHRHLHSDIKKYVCKICKNAFSQAAGLSAHMRKHKLETGLISSDNIDINRS